MSRRMMLAAVAVCALVASCAPALASGTGEEVFRFAILSDRTGGHTPGVYPKVIEAINAQKPEFVVTVGDHIEGYGDDYERVNAEWDSLLALLRLIETPVYLTPGNHDIWDSASEAVYREKVGQKPHFSFDHENTHFVVLDNSRIESWNAIGGLQFSWLLNDLRSTDADNIFVLFHKPFWDSTLRRGKLDALHDRLVAYGVDAVFCGHYHRFFSGEYDGIEYTTIGSSGAAIDDTVPQPELTGQFFQFAMVTLLEDGYELEDHDVATGDVYSRDLVTVELLDEIENIYANLVEVSPLAVPGDGGAASTITLTVENATAGTMDGKAVWTVPEQWQVEPTTVGYNIPPGARHDLVFSASSSGGIYPAPSVSFVYPLTDGRELEIEQAARIVRRVQAPKVSDVLVFDGDVDGFLIESGARVSELYASSGYEPVEGETEFLFAHDGDGLIVSAVCYDDAMDELVTAASERDDAVYRDDCIGFFFQPDPSDLIVYQIYVNSDGVVFDQKITFDENMWWTTHAEWNGEYEIATSRADDRWTAELRIPFETFKGEPGEKTVVSPDLPTHGPDGATTWRLNFRRKQQRTSGAVDWQVPIDYNPETFGEIDLL